jgi:WD40 repeat protein
VGTFHGHSKNLRSALFNADGTRLVTASADDTARVWSVDSGREVAVYPHPGPVVSAAFSPDGSSLVTASLTATRVWRVFPTTQALIDYARATLPRDLSLRQRQQYGLE